MAAFAVPGGFGESNEILDLYPHQEPYNTGGQVKGTQGIQTSKFSPVSGAKWIANNPHVRDIASDLARHATNEFTEGVKQKGRQVITKGVNKVLGNDKNTKYTKGGNKPSRSGSNGSGNGSGRNNSNQGFSGGGGSSSLHRRESSQDNIVWNSGIDAGLVVNPRLHATHGSPLYLASGWLFIETDDRLSEDNPLLEQIKNIMYPLLEQIISNRINRWAGQYIDVSDYVNHFYALVKALQIYYTIDSILAYSANNKHDNINYGMEALRNRIGASALVEFNLLREALENQVCPKPLLEYIRYMMQNFRLSDVPHSSIIRINTGGIFDENWVGGSAVKIVDEIKSARIDILAQSKMTTFLNRGFPEWVIGSLPPSCHNANFDVNFYSFWHNMNCCFYDTVADKWSYTHQHTEIDGYMDYQIYERDTDVDGTIFATYSSFLDTSGTGIDFTVWGVWMPLATSVDKNLPAGDKRESFNLKFVNKSGEVHYISNDVMLGRCGVHWVVQFAGSVGAYTAVPYQFGTPGFVVLQVVNPRMQNEAFNNTVRLWLNPYPIRN